MFQEANIRLQKNTDEVYTHSVKYQKIVEKKQDRDEAQSKEVRSTDLLIKITTKATF